jgi:hypothetical protein
MNLADELPQLLPLACEWAEEQAALIQRDGRTLTSAEKATAVRVGVARTELVRIATVDEIPAPQQIGLRAACEQLGFLGTDTIGLTLGYGVYLKAGQARSERLVAHELRHVAQYEERGSIRAYLAVYIPELLQFGYENAPMERDARKAEGSIVSSGSGLRRW